MSKDLYIADLQNRFPGHTFVETMNESAVEVEFLDAALEVITHGIAQAEGVVVNAYRQIRRQMLQGANPLFMVTTAERDALAGVAIGTIIDNMTTGGIEVWGGSSWGNPAGRGAMKLPAYGEMYQDNDSGETIPNSGIWSGGIVGLLDSNTIVTFNSSQTSQLLLGTDGAGDYAVSFSSNFTNSGGKSTLGCLRISGVNEPRIRDTHAGDSAEQRDLSSAGILNLKAGDTVEYYLESEENVDVIKVYQVNVNIRRIS